MRRVFLGIRPLPDAVATLSRFQDELKALAAPWEIAQPRWTLPANFHLTLHFLGMVPPSRIATLRRDLFRLWPTLAAGGAPRQPLTGWTFFPEKGRAGVGALAATEAVPGLQTWVEGLGALLRDSGFKTEARPFRPHVTLVRFSKPAVLPELAWKATLDFTVENLVLYESSGAEDGPTYLPIQEFRLARGPNPVLPHSH